MGFLKCPFCEQNIDSESKKCFFCGADLNHNYLHALSQNGSVYKHKVEHRVILTTILFIITLFAVIFFLVFFMFRHFH